MALSDHYNRTAKIQAVTRAADGIGGFTESWTTSATVSCRTRQLSEVERTQYQKETTVRLERMYVDPVTITTENRVLIEGETFDVIGVDDPHHEGLFLQVDLEFREGVNG